MMEKVEESWTCRHAPQNYSMLTQNFPAVLVKYRKGHNIKFNEQSAKLSHKSGRVETNNGLFKSIFEKLSKIKKREGIKFIVTKAFFAGT